MKINNSDALEVYTDLVFSLAESLAATLRRKPDMNVRNLARDLYVQTFTFNEGGRWLTGTPSEVVDEQGFYGDLMATLPIV